MGNVTSLTRSGLKDFFVQRVTALIIMAYSLFIIVLLFCVGHKNTDAYSVWSITFDCMWVKVFTVLAFISLIAHAWIGMWTIFTDYVKCAWMRGILQVAAITGYLACFIWLIFILFQAQ